MSGEAGCDILKLAHSVTARRMDAIERPTQPLRAERSGAKRLDHL